MIQKVAIIGAGYIGEIHAKAVKHQANADLVAVVEPLEAKAKAFADTHAIPHIFSSLDDLIKDQICDAVIIGTPNYLHLQQTIQAMSAGLHVMVEKPMAVSLEEAQRMLQISRNTTRVLMVGHCWRYDIEVNWLRDQILQNQIGSIVRTKGYGIHENWGPGGWFVQKSSSGGGALIDMGIHAIDTVRYLLGDPEPESVFAKMGTYYGDYDVDDTGVMLITWKGGTVSSIETGWWQPHSDGPEAATQLFGSQGYGSVFPTYLSKPDRKTGQVVRIENGFVHPREEHCDQGMYDRQMSHFLSCIDEQSIPISNAMIGVTNMSILDALYKSSKSGELIRL